MPQRPATHRPTGHTSGTHLADRQRNQQPHRRLLWTQRYRRFRLAVLAERPVCEDCQRVPSVDVHHTRGLAGYPMDLCDPAAVMCLCHACHSKRTAAGE